MKREPPLDEIGVEWFEVEIWLVAAFIVVVVVVVDVVVVVVVTLGVIS